MTNAKIISGFLLIAIFSTGIYFSLSDAGARLRVDEDKTTYYIKYLDDNGDVYGRWLVSGREYNKIKDGSSLIKRHAKDIDVRHYYYNLSNLDWIDITDFKSDEIIKLPPSEFKTIRTTPYFNEGSIIDTYILDSRIDDAEFLPIEHMVEFYDMNTCGDRGCIYEYEVKDLEYDGITRDAISPEDFGMRMKVEWQEGYYYAKVFQQKSSDKLLVKYRIKDDYVKLNVRLFDPIYFPDDNISTVTYDYNFANKTIYITKHHMINESYKVPIYINKSYEAPCNVTNETECYTPCINLSNSTWCQELNRSVFDHYDTEWHMVNESYQVQEQVPDNQTSKILGVTINGDYYASKYEGGMFFYNDTLSTILVPPGERNWLEYPLCRSFEIIKHACIETYFRGD